MRGQLISKNPFERLPLVGIAKRRPAFLTVPDAKLLISVNKKQWLYEIVIFAINTGMRRGELLSLRWQDIDMSRSVATITNRADFETKSREERVVTLNNASLLVLERQRIKSRCEYVFTYGNGTRLQESNVTHQFKKSVKGAGLPV